MSSVRVPFAVPLALAMTVAACAAILWMTRRFDFYYDEWDFVFGARGWTLRDYFLPHNEHWSTIPALVYRGLLAINGANSYVPFMAALVVLHGAVGFLLFLIIRRRWGDLAGLTAAALVLLLGRGSENILWAFQIGFVGSVAFGLLAVYLLDVPGGSWWRVAVASLALVLALMSSGVGLFFCLAVGADLVLDRGRRRYLAALVVPAAAFLAWYASYGRAGITAHRSPFTLQAVEQLIHYVPIGIGAAAAGLCGLDAGWAQLAMAALAAVIAVSWYRRPPDSRVLGAAFALVAQYALTGLVRAQFGDLQASSPRYVYIGAVFLLLILPSVTVGLRWRSLWTPALALLAVAAVILNILALRHAVAEKNALFATQKAELMTVWHFREAPSLDPQAVVDPLLMPNVKVGRYLESRRAQGSPLPEVDPDGLSRLPSPAVDQALRNTMRLQIAVGPRSATKAVACRPAPQGYSDVVAGDGGGVVAYAEHPGQVQIFVWYQAAGPGPPSAEVLLLPGQAATVNLPNSGAGVTWHLRIQGQGYAGLVSCDLA